MRLIERIDNISKRILKEYMQIWRTNEKLEDVAYEIFTAQREWAEKCYQAQKWLDSGINTEYHDDDVDINIKVKFSNVQDNMWRGSYNPSLNEIDFTVNYKISYEGILRGVSHEVTHAKNNVIGKNKIGHYFNTQTIKSNVRITHVERINDILYRLWSNDEMSAYQSISQDKNIDYIIAYCNDLRDEIIGLKRKTQYDEYIYPHLRDILIQKSLRKVRAIPKENFKEWFIKQSLIRLEKFKKKVLKNWYQYNTDVKPNEANINALSKKNGTKDKITEVKEMLIKNKKAIIDILVEKLSENDYKEFKDKHAYIKYQFKDYEIHFNLWSTFKLKWVDKGNGMHQQVSYMAYSAKGKPATYREKYNEITINPTQALENLKKLVEKGDMSKIDTLPKIIGKLLDKNIETLEEW